MTKEKAQQALDLSIAHGSVSAGGRALGIPLATFRNRYEAALRMKLQPMVQPIVGGDAHAVPEGYKLKGTSTLVDADGNTRLQWIKTDASLERLHEMQRAALKAMCEELKPLKAIKGPKTTDAELLNLYTLTDCHVGALAWARKLASRGI